MIDEDTTLSGPYDAAAAYSVRSGATLTVKSCPSLRHLEKRGIAGGKRTCWATRVLNAALCDGSPFEIVLEETGDFSCRQVLRKKGGQA